MIKKVIFALMWIIGFSASVSAQSTEVFEGESAYKKCLREE